MSRRNTYTRPNNYVKFARKGGVRSSAKLAKAVAGLNRARKMQVMRGPLVQPRLYPDLREKKYLDTQILNSTPIGSDLAAAFQVVSLNIVPQGNTVNTRIGKKIRCMTLQVKGRIQLATGAVAGPAQVRMALVWDREPDKGALVPTIGDIYNSVDPTSMTNRDNAPRFRILRELMFTCPGNQVALAAGAGADDTIQHFEEYLDFSKKDLEVIWTKTDTTGAVVNMIKGDLLWVTAVQQTIANTQLISTVAARLDYSDSAA